MRYLIIRYVPDPIREEFVNIGVLALDDAGVFAVVPLTNWKRCIDFGQEDLTFVFEMLKDLPDVLQKTAPAARYDMIAKMRDAWRMSIQFSEWRASSLTDPTELARDIAKRYLVQP